MSTLVEPQAAQVQSAWPALPLEAWRETYQTLHMWSQVVGKIRLALAPMVNHWWQAPLYVTPRGLTTSAMPHGDRSLEISFDFIDHNLLIESSDDRRKALPLFPRSVADFYWELMSTLRAMSFPVEIWSTPVEVPDPVPFEKDDRDCAYEAEYANRFWRILVRSDAIFKEFRGRFIGKCSPVHFFWGSFDLAVTRFSGRRAPERPGADRVTREAYSHECISHGFWPGGSWFGTLVDGPVYYSYTVPEPPGLREQSIRPTQAGFDPKLSEFILKYEDARRSDRPKEMLMDFLQSTYEAGANRAGWDRAALER